MIQQWWRLTWGLCRFKIGPQDFPYSLSWLIGLFIINVVLAWYPLSVQFATTEAIGRAVSDVLIEIVYAYMVLTLRQRSNRFIQTSVATLSLDLAIYIITFPLVMSYPLLQQMGQGFFQAILYFLFLFIVLLINLWGIFINGFIYRNALDVNFGIGLLVALALVGIEVMLFQ